MKQPYLLSFFCYLFFTFVLGIIVVTAIFRCVVTAAVIFFLIIVFLVVVLLVVLAVFIVLFVSVFLIVVLLLLLLLLLSRRCRRRICRRLLLRCNGSVIPLGCRRADGSFILGADCSVHGIYRIGIAGSSSHCHNSRRRLICALIKYFPALLHAVYRYHFPKLSGITGMGGLSLAHVTDRLTRRRLILGARLRCGQRLADEAYFSARFPGLFAEYIKIQRTSLGLSLNINRRFGVVHKF